MLSSLPTAPMTMMRFRPAAFVTDNFGSTGAVRERMPAARVAGVELIASDQYEELQAVLAPVPR